jgi:hypothetical protein
MTISSNNRLLFLAKTLPIAAVVASILTWQVHTRSGDETFVCEGEACVLGSGASWLLTGITLLGPFIALAGFLWTRRLHRRDRLGPFSPRAIPDSEQIFEVLSVLAAGLATYWLVRNGPSIEAVDVGRPNTWVLELHQWTTDDGEPISRLVPNRRTWFAVGAILAAPFAFSLGSMLSREWYGRERRVQQNAAAADDVIDLTELDSQTVIDLRESAPQQIDIDDA